MRHNGKKEVELGHVLGRAGEGTEVKIGEDSYRVVRTSGFPGVLGDWLLLDYAVVIGTDNPWVEHLSPYFKAKATSVKVTRRVFPKDAGFLERLHGFLVDKGWH